jgi:hypothetical protein
MDLLFSTQIGEGSKGRKEGSKEARVLRLCAMWDSFFSLKKSQDGKK